MNINEILEAIRSTARGEQPEQWFIQWLISHECYGLLNCCPSAFPQLEQVKMLNAAMIKERFSACEPVFKKLGQRGIRYAVVKGAVLSKDAYCDPYIRNSGDLDLLIRKEDAEAVKEMLLEEQFEQGRLVEGEILPYSRRELLYHTALSHQLASFLKQTGRRFCPVVNVDVNFNIYWGESGKQADMAEVLRHTQTEELFGVRFCKLDAVHSFVALCMHHYKDMNSAYLLVEGSLQLNLFSDLYFYLKEQRPEPAKLKKAAEKLGVQSYIDYCLYYTQCVFQDLFLNEYTKLFEDAREETLLSCYGLNDAERRQWKTPFLERLFDETFPETFADALSKKEREKVLINKTMMQ